MEKHNHHVITNREISLPELLDAARKYIQTDDLKNALHYLNMAYMLPSLDIIVKCNILSIMCLAYSRAKNEDNQTKISRKIFKYLKNTQTKIPDEVLTFFIKILYRSATALNDNSKYFLSSLFYYQAKCIYDEYNLKFDDNSMETIESSFSSSLKRITENVYYLLNI